MGLDYQDLMVSLVLHNLNRRKASFKLKKKTHHLTWYEYWRKLFPALKLPKMQFFLKTCAKKNECIQAITPKNMLWPLYGILYSRVPPKDEKMDKLYEVSKVPAHIQIDSKRIW